MPKKLTREQMIEQLISRVDDWDVSMLLDYVKAQLRNDYDDLSKEELQDEYDYCVKVA